MRSGVGSLTLPEFEMLDLWMQGASMVGITGIIIQLEYCLRLPKKLSKEMQFSCNSTPCNSLWLGCFFAQLDAQLFTGEIHGVIL